MEIAIVAGSAGLLSITALIGVITLALKLSDAKDASAASAVKVAEVQAQLAIANTAIATKTNEANSERDRANALDDALSKAEQEMAGDPRGALDRLLSHWKAAKATGATTGGGAGAVPPQRSTATPAIGGDGLLQPGE